MTKLNLPSDAFIQNLIVNLCASAPTTNGTPAEYDVSEIKREVGVLMEHHGDFIRTAEFIYLGIKEGSTVLYHREELMFGRNIQHHRNVHAAMAIIIANVFQPFAQV